MANKLLILVLGAVVVASLVVGGLLGMQFAGDGGDDPLTTTQPTAATTAAPTDSQPSTTAGEATETATPAATTTPTPGSTFSPESVNATAVEYHLRALIDAEVREGGQPLDEETTLDEMAQFHTDNMVEQGYPAHDAGGYSTRARYEKFDRYSYCRVPSDNNAGIRDGEELEVVGRVTLNLSEDPTEREIARQVLDDWSDDETYMKRLSLQNAEDAGVGVGVSQDARVYVTVDLC